MMKEKIREMKSIVQHCVAYIPHGGHTVSHRRTRVAAGVAEAIDHTRTMSSTATRSFDTIRDSVRITLKQS